MKFFHGLLLFFFSSMLLLAPPGGAVCWPLPDGRHIHIGWNDSDGQATLGLTVFTHRASQAVGDRHSLSFVPNALFEPPTSVDVLPPVILAWLLPLIGLGWLLLTEAVFPSPWRFRPSTPPPRVFVSTINAA